MDKMSQAVELFGAVVGVVTLITKLTSTQKDDSVWGKILQVLSVFSLVNPDGSVVGKGR
jgi:hypothetical protein